MEGKIDNILRCKFIFFDSFVFESLCVLGFGLIVLGKIRLRYINFSIFLFLWVLFYSFSRRIKIIFVILFWVS